jgi:thioredoxin reductase
VIADGGVTCLTAGLTVAPRGHRTLVLTGDVLLGDAVVTRVRGRNAADGLTDLECAGVFVYIGLEPNTAFLGDFMALDRSGKVPTDDKMRTEHRGIATAGNVRAGAPGRAASAAGDGSAAAIAADRYLTGGWWSDSKCEQAAGMPTKGD